jgi:hypothetical protein
VALPRADRRHPGGERLDLDIGVHERQQRLDIAAVPRGVGLLHGVELDHRISKDERRRARVTTA